MSQFIILEQPYNEDKWQKIDNKLRVFLGKRRILIAAKLELFYANKNWPTVSRCQ